MSDESNSDACPSLTRDGDVFLLDLGNGENRFNPTFLDAVEAHLDEVHSAAPPRALVTMATGKFWSNGLDLEWMGAHQGQIEDFVPRVHALLARMLELDVPSVAALQGHTFAAGAMLALAHDQRLMRADRGFFCLPEVDINIPFTVGMNALIRGRLSPQIAHAAMTTGRRYGGHEAATAGIVEEALDAERLLDSALEIAAALAPKDPATLGTIKQRLYASTLSSLRQPESTLERRA